VTFVVYAVLALAALVFGAIAFVRTSPARLASVLAVAGPLLLGVVGVVLLVTGRAGLGGLALSSAAGWYMAGRARRGARPTPGKRSTVRTAALEMELDHDSGGLEGLVLAGRHEGKVLGRMSRAELIELRADLASDGESLQLLETYLDGRFPGWREDPDPDAGRREGAAPRSGAMTEQEAYQVLGLEAGASTADIRKAHRRLMQRLHPDIGGSSFLAARINEAKDVLLNGHE